MILKRAAISCEEVEAEPSECALTSPHCQLAALWGEKKCHLRVIAGSQEAFLCLAGQLQV